MAVDFERLQKINNLASSLKAQGIVSSMDDALKMAEDMLGAKNRFSDPSSDRVPTIHELAERRKRTISSSGSKEPEIVGVKHSESALEGGSTSIQGLIDQVRRENERLKSGEDGTEIVGVDEEGPAEGFDDNERDAAEEASDLADDEYGFKESESIEGEEDVVSDDIEITEASEQDLDPAPDMEEEEEISDYKDEVSRDLDEYSSGESQEPELESGTEEPGVEPEEAEVAEDADPEPELEAEPGQEEPAEEPEPIDEDLEHGIDDPEPALEPEAPSAGELEADGDAGTDLEPEEPEIEDGDDNPAVDDCEEAPAKEERHSYEEYDISKDDRTVSEMMADEEEEPEEEQDGEASDAEEPTAGVKNLTAQDIIDSAEDNPGEDDWEDSGKYYDD